jgi:hypothetical protein
VEECAGVAWQGSIGFQPVSKDHWEIGDDARAAQKPLLIGAGHRLEAYATVGHRLEAYATLRIRRLRSTHPYEIAKLLKNLWT